MANKNVFSYARNGKRKIGHSKFDMGFEHITSGNFGSLKPVACFETLPDDYWDISQNTVTLLKPLTAPAMTRINQNFYGAYVRNQQIWEHWNDYISNGTAYSDVYGNNITNQNLDNLWEVPSIPTPYLQVISKIGAGNATPVWNIVLEFSNVSYQGGKITLPSEYDNNIFLHYIFDNFLFKNLSNTSLYNVTDVFRLGTAVGSTTFSRTSQQGNFFSEFDSLGLYNVMYEAFIWNPSHPSSGKLSFHLEFRFHCSYRQFQHFARFCQLITTSAGISPTQTQEIGSQAVEFYSTNASPNQFKFCFLCDEVSTDPTTATSAFIHERSSYYDSNGHVVKSIDFIPRLVDSGFVEIISTTNEVGGTISDYSLFQSIANPFMGWRIGVVRNYDINGLVISSYFGSSLMFESGFDDTTSFYWISNFSSFIPLNVYTFFEGISSYLPYFGVTVKDWYRVFDRFTATYNHSHNLPIEVGQGDYATEFGFSQNVGSISVLDCACDLRFDFSKLNNVPSTLGFDNISEFVYLCKNSMQLMDSFNIKIDPLCSRPFIHYRYELTNALPFMAYSKIWNDNFRNAVVSCPELDYKTVNGPIFCDSFYYRYFVYEQWAENPAVIPPHFANKTYSDFSPNGWVLEVETAPRNSQSSKFHTHLPVTSFSHVIALLTGFGLSGWVAECAADNVKLNMKDFYVPSYYNGLLHLKYQNFNKDYFTSAMLDPMSGANQVAVGSTINELRENEAKQHWWERTAMYRSIKNFFQGTYGITPVELPEDSRITGVDHTDVQIGEVIQTSASTPESPQGSRTGLGGAHGKGSLCHGHANEHGWIIILMSHTVESQYLQSYDKMWDVKESFLDYPTVDFAGIGNESILQKEVNYTTVNTLPFDEFFERGSANGDFYGVLFRPITRNARLSFSGTSNPLFIYQNNGAAGSPPLKGNFNLAHYSGTSLNNVFGFIPRYSSYKFKFDQVSGQFRNELAFWHTFKRYFSMPILCHEFVNWELAADDEDINRIFAVTEDLYDDKFCIDCFINASVDRALPFVCVPSTK